MGRRRLSPARASSFRWHDDARLDHRRVRRAAGARRLAPGFIVGALSLAGFAVGALLGTRLGPLLLPDGSRSPYAPLFGLVGALLVGGVLASGLERVGRGCGGGCGCPGSAPLDGVLGALLSAALALGIAWIVGAVALQTPGAARAARATSSARRSCARSTTCCRRRARSSTRSRASTRSRDRRAAGRTSRRRARGSRATRRSRAAAPSVVRVLGTACGLGVEGSGWVAGAGLVVTNAHVVAGRGRHRRAGARRAGPSSTRARSPSTPRNDVAVLRVDGLGAPALRARRRSAPRAPAARSSASRTTGRSTCAPARLGATRDRALAGRLRPRAGAARRSRRCAGACARATRAGRWSTRRGRVLTHGVRRATTQRPAGRLRRAQRGRARRARRRARGATVSTGPCAR